MFNLLSPPASILAYNEPIKPAKSRAELIKKKEIENEDDILRPSNFLVDDV